MNHSIGKMSTAVPVLIPGKEIRTLRTPHQARVPKPFAGVAFFVCAFALFWLSKAQAQAPSIMVTPTTFQSENSLQVSGSGLADATIVIWLDLNGNGQFDPGEPAPISTFVSDSNGSLSFEWPLHNIPAGSFSIRAGICRQPLPGLCFGTTSLASTPVTVMLGVSSYTFGSGTTVTVTGFGFSPNASANVWYDSDPNGVLSACGGSSPPVTCSAAPATDSNGAFSTPLLVRGSPGDYFIHASSDTAATPQNSIPVKIGTCLFQECIIDNVDTMCFIGRSPSDQLLPFTDCKQLDNNYTGSPTGYDLNNTGPVFGGAGLLAAAVADLLQSVPGAGTTAMAAAIANSKATYDNAGPDDASLLAIASLQTIGICPICTGPLDQYITAVEISGHVVPEKEIVKGAVAQIKAAAIVLGPVLGPPALVAAGGLISEAAIAGSIACGYVNYYCNGSDITKTILGNPDIQTQGIPVNLLQLASHNDPNPCANGLDCWGGLIGWGQVACTTLVPSPMCCTSSVCSSVPASGSCSAPAQMRNACEQPDNSSQLPIPGSAGAPDNSGAPLKCATGTVVGLSIGYDGDVSFDVNGPGVMPLVNYHNFAPGPGGTEPPNGIDIESPLSDRPQFSATFAQLRPGIEVNVCGRWVADMHMLWNELHPLTSINLLTNINSTHRIPPAAWIAAVAEMLDGED